MEHYLRHAYRLTVSDIDKDNFLILLDLMKEQAILSTRGEPDAWDIGWFSGGVAVKFERIADWRHFDNVFSIKNAMFFAQNNLIDPARDRWLARATPGEKRVYIRR
ncbi:MAG: hypothetical protein K2X54_21095 [Methylobacterium organophilum]|nr:hypothetical protein [Methylobacterium organophilum]